VKKPVKRHRVVAVIYDRRGVQPESTCACTSSGSITAPRSRIRWRAGWWSRPIATADIHSSLYARCRASQGAVWRGIDWALANLDRPLSVADLARASSLSARTLARRFHDELGATPHQWLNRQRVLAAQERLERSHDSIEEVASAVGFRSAQTLRLHFRRVARTSPTAYRARFSTRARRRA